MSKKQLMQAGALAAMITGLLMYLVFLPRLDADYGDLRQRDIRAYFLLGSTCLDEGRDSSEPISTLSRGIKGARARG